MALFVKFVTIFHENFFFNRWTMKEKKKFNSPSITKRYYIKIFDVLFEINLLKFFANATAHTLELLLKELFLMTNLH